MVRHLSHPIELAMGSKRICTNFMNISFITVYILIHFSRIETFLFSVFVIEFMCYQGDKYTSVLR
jgi:hypothetical protein